MKVEAYQARISDQKVFTDLASTNYQYVHQFGINIVLYEWFTTVIAHHPEKYKSAKMLMIFEHDGWIQDVVNLGWVIDAVIHSVPNPRNQVETEESK